jgi:hypothetical protein
VDDFGIRYSSLSTLRREVIARVIITMPKQFCMTVVAAGDHAKGHDAEKQFVTTMRDYEPANCVA